MDCITKETLYAYAEDDLSPEEERGVKAHLSTCARCRGELLLLRRIGEVLAEEPLSEPSSAFARKVMAQVPLGSSWMESGWRYVAWAAFITVAVWLSLWTDWGTDLGRASERLWMRVEDRVEEAITSMETGRGRAMGHFADWTEGWQRRVNDGLEAVGHAGERTWFLPIVLISLVGLALYHLLDVLYEDRRPRTVGS